MKKLLFLALALVATGLSAQRTGKDSISVESGIYRFNPSMTTVELNQLTRPNSTNRAIAYNEDTKTLWGWDGTQWIDLYPNLGSSGITIDPIILNGSTNPVENNAIFDRFVTTVDEAGDSPNTDVRIWWGGKDDWVTANKVGNILAVIDDSTAVAGLPGGVDSYITNVIVQDDSLVFSANGDAFNGAVPLPVEQLAGSTDNQRVEQFTFNPSTNQITLDIERTDAVVADLSPLVQDASQVDLDDSNLPIAADDVQEALDKLFEFGTASVSYTFGPNGAFGFPGLINGYVQPTDFGSTTIKYQRLGNIVHFTITVSANIPATLSSNRLPVLMLGTITWPNIPFPVGGFNAVQFTPYAEDLANLLPPSWAFTDSGNFVFSSDSSQGLLLFTGVFTPLQDLGTSTLGGTWRFNVSGSYVIQ